MTKAKLKSIPKDYVMCEMVFSSNDHALAIFGPEEEHLKLIQQSIAVTLKTRGNIVILDGTEKQALIAKNILKHLENLATTNNDIKKSDVLDSIRHFKQDNAIDMKTAFEKHAIAFSKKKILPRSKGQLKYLSLIMSHDITIGIGPAGTGKTYLAMAVGMAKLLRGDVDRVILTRPAVEAGERLGFLPGDLAEKVNPYLRPLYDALHDMVSYEKAAKMIASGQIEIAPIAFMRGRTLNNSYVILDEAQNCTREQMKMFLTRLGDNCQTVITGDITQVDLPKETKSGLRQALKILNKIEGIAIHQFNETDVVRHPLVIEIIKAYERERKIP